MHERRIEEQAQTKVESSQHLPLRITGMAPLMATVYACERLRCNLCGEVYTAPAPEGVGDEKYDATATSIMHRIAH